MDSPIQVSQPEPVASLSGAPAEALRRAAVVLNRSAGALLAQGDMHGALAQAFADHGLAATFVPQDAGDLPARMRLACAQGADLVVVAGGDGSVACAAQALMDVARAGGIAPPLGILPFGTMNLLAKDLGIPTGDLPAALRALARGEPRRIDVGDVNGRVFLCGSMLGEPARLARHREAGRGRSRWHTWTQLGLAGLRALRRRYALRLSIRVGNQRVRLRSPSVTVTVGPLDEGQSGAFARAALDAGTLAAYAVHRLRPLDVLRLAARAAFGHWRQDRAIREWLAPRLVIASRQEAMRVMNDGEVMMIAPPLRYRVQPQALVVIAPAPAVP